MRYPPWLLFVILIASFVGIVLAFPFKGPIALSIHFVRIAATVAGMIIYIRMLLILLTKGYWSRSDYLIAAVNFFLISLVCFSFYNEAGRIFDVDTSVFTSYISGLFSIFAIIAAVCAIIAPDTGGNRPKIVAVAVAAVVSVGLVFIAPLFR